MSGASAKDVAAKIANARAASAASEVFRILLFLIAFPYLTAIARIGAVCLSSGDLSDALPFLAICVMCISYLFRGLSQVIARLQAAVKWEKISD